MNGITGLLVLLATGSLLVYVSPQLWTPRASRYLTMICMIAAWILWGITVSSGATDWQIGQIAYVADGVTFAAGTLVLLLGTFVVIYADHEASTNDRADIYYTLLLALVAFMIAVTHAADLFNLWLWFECMAVAAYVLVAFHNQERDALEATMKYFVQSVAGSTLILAGIALLLAETGSVSLAVIRDEASTTTPYLMAGALFVVGFGMKAALVPLHTWLPDAHSQAPASISAMLSGVVIATGLIALLRAIAPLNDANGFGLLLMGIAALNIVIGNLLALRQTQVKRLLAYSSVAHMGYIVLAIGIGLYAGQQTAIEGGLFHIISHGLMKGLAFLASGALLYNLYRVHDRHGTLTIDDLSGAARRYPMASMALAVALFGLGGLPPMVGFMSKWQIFAGGIAAHDTAITILLVIAGLGSIVSLAYYVPVVNSLYRQQMSPVVEQGGASGPIVNRTIGVLAFVIVITGLLPGLLDWLVQTAGTALAASFGL